MAFDYGSIDLGIENPFKIEGTIQSIVGFLIFFLGVLSLFSVQGQIENKGQEVGVYLTVVGVWLIGWGLTKLSKGLFQVFRFFVGRSVPANLAKNWEKSQADKQDISLTYTHQQLEQMLQGRQNISFKEPGDWFSRLIHSIFPRLLYLPLAYRNMSLRIARAVVQTLIVLLCFGLAWFSGTTGVTDITTTPVMNWLIVFLAIYLGWVWYFSIPPLTRLLDQEIISMPGVTTLTLWIAVAILLPIGMSYWHNELEPLSTFESAPLGQLGLLFTLGIISTVAFALLISTRSRMARPIVEVAEFRDNWQESIHPHEIFIHFEDIVMANRRYKEVPNRIYRGYDPTLEEEGSSDKGNFSGEMIQETQPVYYSKRVSDKFLLVRTITTGCGALFSFVAAMMIYFSPDIIASSFVSSSNILTAGPLMHYIGYLVTVVIFAGLLTNLSHFFWAEMQFESLLVYFQCHGTYTESKISMGTSIYDSARSENVVVRSSITPWLLATRAVTSTFALSGANNLEQRRYILEMHKSQAELESIVDEIKDFVTKRQAIASISNEKDLEAASSIFQVNQQTRDYQERLTKPDHPIPDQEQLQDSSSKSTQDQD